MSRPRLATLLVFFAVVGMVVPVAASGTRGHHHHPPLLDCGPAPVLSKNDDATFRANLASVLATLPSTMAAQPHAFATLQIGKPGPGSAFTRGACFSTRSCKTCLSSAARDVTGGCVASGRAGVWRNECFLSYAESNASSPREASFRGWFYAAPSTTNATLGGVDGECMTDRSVDCARCFDDSARAAAALGWWQRILGEEVIVVGYSCFLRVRISTLPQGPPDYGSHHKTARNAFGVLLCVAVDGTAFLLGFLFVRIIKIVRALPQPNNNG
ncbi:hypothetical protein QOZ80_2BG0165260 [Eleusine coracana subsp. coracana]|nr:hypothetical protein QOZ80_2BG0165260 [Eleusine coracana subsp. coracana]